MNQPAFARRVVLTVTACTLALSGLWLWLRLTIPSDDARLPPGQAVWSRDGVVVTPLEAQPGGLRQGDVVVAVGGRSLESWAEALFRSGAPGPQWRLGQTVTYTVLRGGHQLEVSIKLERYPLGALVQDEWGFLAFTLVFALVGTYVLLRRPNDRAARTLFQSAWSLLVAVPWVFGLQVSDLFGGPSFWLYHAIVLGVYILFWISLLHFTLVFPTQHPLTARRPWVIPLIYIAPFACYLVYLVAARYVASSTLSWIGLWEPGEATLGLLYVVLAVAAMTASYRASRDPATRQKIRWVVFGTVVSGGGTVVLWIFPADVLGHPILSTNALGLLLFPFPLGIAIAILRHRLFDIDVLIKRTLVYGSLTGTLAAVYAGLIIGLQSLAGAITGQSSQSPLVIVASTLAIVALFQPVRRRIQIIIDRRFYRRKYDAARTLEAFSATLRNEVELTRLSEQLLDVINETMQPAQVSLWLRPPEWQEEGQPHRLEAHGPGPTKHSDH
jgi:hypothetical protein